MKKTNEQKISILSECDEILITVKILTVAFKDMNLQSDITMIYDYCNEQYELKFSKITK